MNEFIEKLIGRLEEEKKYCSYHPHTRDEAINKAIEIVNELAEEYSTDTPQKSASGWIPCSERLPEGSELVLIYAESRARGGSIRVVGHLHNGFWFAQTSSDTLGLTGIGQFNVIAWQPLPQPYKENENDKI